jgi:hypothetical protein
MFARSVQNRKLASVCSRAPESNQLNVGPYGRGAGVGRGLGVGVGLGSAVAVAVAVAVGATVTVGHDVGVAVNVAVAVAVAVDVAVDVAVGVALGAQGPIDSTVVEAAPLTPPPATKPRALYKPFAEPPSWETLSGGPARQLSLPGL